jgi:predicted membrane channel-forming protein YqfA (hemolysin III family)
MSPVHSSTNQQHVQLRLSIKKRSKPLLHNSAHDSDSAVIVFEGCTSTACNCCCVIAHSTVNRQLSYLLKGWRYMPIYTHISGSQTPFNTGCDSP